MLLEILVFSLIAVGGPFLAVTVEDYRAKSRAAERETE